VAVRVAIGLGSNLGDRARHINDAVAALSKIGDLVAMSSLYETDPIGGPEQGAYLNAVAMLETALAPDALLAECLRIERDHGRERRERWGPRTLDLDVLLYGDVARDEPGLTVPHPRLAERRFVLEPLLEVWPDAALPDGSPLAPELANVSGQRVRRFHGSSSARASAFVAIVVTIAGALAIWWILDAVLR